MEFRLRPLGFMDFFFTKQQSSGSFFFTFHFVNDCCFHQILDDLNVGYSVWYGSILNSLKTIISEGLK